MSKYFAVLFVVLAASFSVDAITQQERESYHAELAPSLAECGKEFGITLQDVKAARENGKLGELDPCFMACFYKANKYMNAEGVFDKDVAVQSISKHVANPEDKAKITKLGETCSKVNTEAVSDGPKGCERSRLLYACLKQYRSEIGL